MEPAGRRHRGGPKARHMVDVTEDLKLNGMGKEDEQERYALCSTGWIGCTTESNRITESLTRDAEALTLDMDRKQM